MTEDKEPNQTDHTALVRRSAFIARQTRDLAKRVQARSRPLNDTEVVFPDKNLEAAIRQFLGKPEGKITIEDVKGLVEFDSDYFVEFEDLVVPEFTNISGMENLTNLRRLMLGGNQITDITPLKNLTNLEDLRARPHPNHRHHFAQEPDKPYIPLSHLEPNRGPDSSHGPDKP